MHVPCEKPKAATYGEAKLVRSVSTLYIVQVKRKHSILSRKCYNKAKAENPKMLLCPPDREAAIEESLRFFGMIA